MALGFLLLWLFSKGMDLSWEAFFPFIFILSVMGGLGLTGIISSEKLNRFWMVLICISVAILILIIEVGLMTLYGGGFRNF